MRYQEAMHYEGENAFHIGSELPYCCLEHLSTSKILVHSMQAGADSGFCGRGSKYFIHKYVTAHRTPFTYPISY